MSIATQIERLQGVKSAIRTALISKGILASDHDMDDFADDIMSIPDPTEIIEVNEPAEGSYEELIENNGYKIKDTYNGKSLLISGKTDKNPKNILLKGTEIPANKWFLSESIKGYLYKDKLLNLNMYDRMESQSSFNGNPRVLVTSLKDRKTVDRTKDFQGGVYLTSLGGVELYAYYNGKNNYIYFEKEDTEYNINFITLSATTYAGLVEISKIHVLDSSHILLVYREVSGVVSSSSWGRSYYYAAHKARLITVNSTGITQSSAINISSAESASVLVNSYIIPMLYDSYGFILISEDITDSDSSPTALKANALKVNVTGNTLSIKNASSWTSLASSNTNTRLMLSEFDKGGFVYFNASGDPYIYMCGNFDTNAKNILLASSNLGSVLPPFQIIHKINIKGVLNNGLIVIHYRLMTLSSENINGIAVANYDLPSGIFWYNGQLDSSSGLPSITDSSPWDVLIGDLFYNGYQSGKLLQIKATQETYKIYEVSDYIEFWGSHNNDLTSPYCDLFNGIEICY